MFQHLTRKYEEQHSQPAAAAAVLGIKSIFLILHHILNSRCVVSSICAPLYFRTNEG